MERFADGCGLRITRISGLLVAAMMLMTAGTASAGKTALWVVNRSGNFVAEFAGKSLKQSGENDPSRKLVSSDLKAPWGLIFDSSKNLWVSNLVSSGNTGTLTMFTFKQLKGLKNNDAPAAAVVISGLNRPEGMAFDNQGNLWVANEGNGQLLEFSAFQLGSSGSPPPVITISSANLSSPVGIAFDSSGRLWVADDEFNQVAMFTKAQLAAGGTQAATVILTNDGSGSIDTCEPLIFDKSGNMWVGNLDSPGPDLGTVVKFTPGQLTASGSPTPAVTLNPITVTNTSASSLDIPTGLAFDKSGNLWVGNEDSDQSGSVAKFSKPSITSSGSPQPSVFIDSNASKTNLHEPFFLTFGPKVP